jgi:Mlc titration factor MtfA (ptsG expression regulator)
MFSNSDAFKSFYDKYSDDYVYPIKIHGIFTDKYMNSTPSEFFAGIFEAYILYPSYLEENYPGIYHYFNILTSENKLI